jgi:hypothetical protein
MTRLSCGSHHLFFVLISFSLTYLLPPDEVNRPKAKKSPAASLLYSPEAPTPPPSLPARRRPQRRPPSLLAGSPNAAALPPCSPEAPTPPPFLPALRRPQRCRLPSLLAGGPNAAASRAVSATLLLGFPATLLLGVEEKARRPVRPTSLRKSGGAAVVWPTRGRL